MVTVLEQFLTQNVTNSFTFIQSLLVYAQSTELPVSRYRLAASLPMNLVSSSNLKYLPQVLPPVPCWVLGLILLMHHPTGWVPGLAPAEAS